MFADVSFARSEEGGIQRDDDGAKRAFFGGERFLEGIAGEAYVTPICLQSILDEFCFILDNGSVIGSHVTEFTWVLQSYVNTNFTFFYQITVQRTELNDPLGLEVQLHITEAVCPALSEPGK